MKDGGSAFPFTLSSPGGGATNIGMSLRDWFAGQALAGLSANPDYTQMDWEVVTHAAYHAADLMLEMRDEK